MTDLAEITALVNSYALLLDGGDMDAVTALFSHSAWRSERAGSPGGERVLHGSEEVRPIYAQIKIYDDGTPRTKHLLTNLTIDLKPGAGTATSHCYWTVLQNLEQGGPIDIILSGQYVDKFEKAQGTWRFAERFIKVDLNGDASAHMR
ncbi:MAG: nuclear transport factor 2 family protein [Acidimicrobiales bacterium]